MILRPYPDKLIIAAFNTVQHSIIMVRKDDRVILE